MIYNDSYFTLLFLRGLTQYVRYSADSRSQVTIYQSIAGIPTMTWRRQQVTVVS